MTMAMGRDAVEAPPISARERAIPFAPMAEMDLAATPDPSQVQQKRSFGAARSEHRTVASRLARSRRPYRVAKSP